MCLRAINKTNNKRYCGITYSVKNRWRNNGIAYKPDKDRNQNRPFWNAICKYGWDGFDHVVLEENLTFEQACEREKHYIKSLELTNKLYGYNVAEGGNGGKVYKEHPRGMLGKPQTEEQKENQRLVWERSLKGNNTKWKNGHPRGMLGKRHTEEHKLYISEKMKGRVFSDETKRKMSESFKARKFSEESKRKMSVARNGKRTGSGNSFSKKVVVRKGDEIKLYDTTKQLMEDMGISTQLFYKIVNSEEEYIARGNVKNKYAHLNGITIDYV